MNLIDKKKERRAFKYYIKEWSIFKYCIVDKERNQLTFNYDDLAACLFDTYGYYTKPVHLDKLKAIIQSYASNKFGSSGPDYISYSRHDNMIFKSIMNHLFTIHMMAIHSDVVTPFTC